MSDRYYYDEDVFARGLVDRCRKALGNNYAVISFRSPGEPLTSTEQKVPRDLVEECRMSLKLSGISSRRNVYFGGSGIRGPRQNEKKDVGIRLIEKGHSAEAVADALGVTRSTVSRWVPSKRALGAAGHAQTHADTADLQALARGLEKMCLKYEVAFSETSIDDSITNLSRVMWVRPDKLSRRAVCAGNAIADIENLSFGSD